MRPKVQLSLDFSDYRGGPVAEWLAAKGFEAKEDAQDEDKLRLGVDDGALVLAAKEPVFGLLVNEELDLEDYSRLRIEWGVQQFPKGASYDDGVNNEAVMVMVFFGDETRDSGSLFVPDIPYFIGFFLCSDDRTGHPYVGRYHQENGRYICLDRPAPGETVISELEVARAFELLFGAPEAPPISGIAISSDTSSSEGNGRINRLRQSDPGDGVRQSRYRSEPSVGLLTGLLQPLQQIGRIRELRDPLLPHLTRLRVIALPLIVIAEIGVRVDVFAFWRGRFLFPR